MICFISKWLISGALDSHKAIPGFLRPHTNRCTGCQDFIHLTQTFEKQAAADAQIIINETPDSLQEKAKTQPLYKIKQNRQTLRQPRKLIPAVAVSLAAVLLAVFLVFQPSQGPSPSIGMNSFFTFGKSSLPEGTLQKLASQIESPYDTEWNHLKKNIVSAAETLKTQLNFRREPERRQE